LLPDASSVSATEVMRNHRHVCSPVPLPLNAAVTGSPTLRVAVIKLTCPVRAGFPELAGLLQAAIIKITKTENKAGLSTQYVAMIELGRKFPSPEILEKIASALELDTPEMFSMPPSVKRAALQLRNSILNDLEKTVGDTVNAAVKVAVSKLVATHLQKYKDIDMPQDC